MKQFSAAKFLSLGILLAFVISVSAAALINCPDCKKPVSSRAVHCPNCGCPGYAIAEEAAKIREKTRPKPILHVVTPNSTGFGVAVASGNTNYVIMDEELLGELDSLQITLHDRSESLDYQGLEILSTNALVRFKISSEKVEFLSIYAGETPKENETSILYLQDTAKLIDRNIEKSIAKVDLSGHVIAINTNSKGFVTLDKSQQWMKISPSEYRSQATFLKKLESGKISRAELLDDQIKSPWISEYLKSKANRLLRN